MGTVSAVPIGTKEKEEQITNDDSFLINAIAALQGEVAQMATMPSPVTPTITSISPTSGLNSGGETVTITGTGFSYPGSFPVRTVWFGGPNAAFVVDSDTQITAISPPNDPPGSNVNVGYTNSEGQLTRSPNVAQFVYLYPTSDSTEVTSVSPDTAANRDGVDSVTIAGVGFTGATGIVWGGVQWGASFTVVSDIEITTTSPGSQFLNPPSGGVSFSVDVQVLDVNGKVSLANPADLFTYPASG